MLRMSFSPLIVLEPTKLAGGRKFSFPSNNLACAEKATRQLCAATPWVSLNSKFVLFKEPLGHRSAPRFTQTHSPFALKVFLC